MENRFFLLVLKNKYTEKKMNQILLHGITMIIRYLICSLVSFFIYMYINYYIGFVFDIIFSVVLILNTSYLYVVVNKYEEETIMLADYFYKNYSQENFRIWKKKFVITSSIYYIIYYSIFEITSKIMIQYIIQSLIIYMLVDNIENRNGILYTIYNKIQDLYFIRVKKYKNIELIEDYSIKKSSSIDISQFQTIEENKLQYSPHSNVPHSRDSLRSEKETKFLTIDENKLQYNKKISESKLLSNIIIDEDYSP